MRIVRVGSKGADLWLRPFFIALSQGALLVCIEDEEVSVDKCRSRINACAAHLGFWYGEGGGAGASTLGRSVTLLLSPY